jgi:hypothetical protein
VVGDVDHMGSAAGLGPGVGHSLDREPPGAKRQRQEAELSEPEDGEGVGDQGRRAHAEVEQAERPPGGDEADQHAAKAGSHQRRPHEQECRAQPLSDQRRDPVALGE